MLAEGEHSLSAHTKDTSLVQIGCSGRVYSNRFLSGLYHQTSRGNLVSHYQIMGLVQARYVW